MCVIMWTLAHPVSLSLHLPPTLSSLLHLFTPISYSLSLTYSVVYSMLTWRCERGHHVAKRDAPSRANQDSHVTRSNRENRDKSHKSAFSRYVAACPASRERGEIGRGTHTYRENREVDICSSNPTQTVCT